MLAGRRLSLVQIGHQLNAINWPLAAVSGIFLFLRIVLKLRQRRPLWWDDYALIASWTALLSQSALFAHAISLGYGKPPSGSSPEEMNAMMISVSASCSLLILAHLWSKTSFGITLLRLPLGRFRTWFVCVLIGLGTVTIGLSAYFVWVQCLVADPPWGPFMGPKCLDPGVLIKYSISVGYFSAFIDFSFVVLPWNLIWKLQMKKSEKVGVTLAMGMGVFAGIAAIVKTTVFPKIYTSDLTAPMQVTAWGALETALSIMAASIPILRALVRQQAGQGVPMGYQTGDRTLTTTTMQSGASNVVVRDTEAGLRTESGGSRPHAEEASVSTDEALSGKQTDGKRETVRAPYLARMSFELDSYGAEARPRDFTV